MDALAHVARVLAVRLGNMGDVVMFSPALRFLRRVMPRARFTLMVSPAGAQAAALLPGVDEVLVHRALWQEAGSDLAFDASREQALIEELRARQFGAAFLFTNFLQSPVPAAYACYLAGIPIRVAQSREFGGALLTHWVRPLPDSSHQVDRNLQLLKAVGIPISGGSATRLGLSIPREAQARADKLLRECGVRGGFVVIAPGATCSARRYPLARYIDVAARLQQTGHGVLVAGGVADQDAGKALVGAVSGTVSLCGETSLAELAGLLRRARLLITNHSGLVHIGEAVGCPMVILSAGTEPEGQWRPRAAPVRLLRHPTACQPCYCVMCPYDQECLAIAASDVVAEAMALLGETLREVAGG